MTGSGIPVILRDMNDTSNALTAKTRDIDLVTTAKIMRKHLAQNFPGVKFSVRTSRFSMGSSADVSWTDGPTGKQVDAVVSCFSYGGFDGMTDSSYYYGAWLCDEHGATYRHNSPGGTVEAGDGAPCCLGAEPVSFGAKYVGTNRKLSPAFEQAIKEQIEAVTGLPFSYNGRFDAHVFGGRFSEDDERAGTIVACTGSPQYGSDLFHKIASQTAK